jgi:hypothetical protein
MLKRFFSQPVKAHRNLHLIVGALGVQFLISAIGYFFFPDTVLHLVNVLDKWVFLEGYKLSEESQIWRVLAASDVFTLAWLCFGIQANILRFREYVGAFLVLKCLSAVGFLYVYLFEYTYPLFLGIFLWDGFNGWLVYFFSGKAHDALKDADEEVLTTLVPPLLFSRK